MNGCNDWAIHLVSKVVLKHALMELSANRLVKITFVVSHCVIDHLPLAHDLVKVREMSAWTPEELAALCSLT